MDLELALSAYHADGWDDRGAHVGSPAEFIDWVLPELQKFKGTSHSITNISCEITGDVAHAESYITFHVWTADATYVTFGNARYIDRLERRDGRWAIAHREAVIDYRAKLEIIPSAGGSELKGLQSMQDRSYLRPLVLSEDAKRRLAEKSVPVSA